MRIIVFLISFLTFFTTLFAKDYDFESKNTRVNIIELYTSQGCNSCPPADRWLSNLKNHPKLFSEFIPLAFHITYWNYIGWNDVFAKKLHDNRQRYYSNKVWKKNSVYTPQFIINAKEYRRWFSNQSFPKFENKYGGELKAKLSDDILNVSYQNKNIQNEDVYLNVAILGFDYEIDIKAGENKYKTLEHDFVVLDHVQKFAKIKNNKLDINTKLFNLKKDNRDYAIAIWISQYNSNILQATGGYL